MSEKEIITNLNNILKKWQEIINIKDEEEKEIEMNMYFEEMPFYEIQGLLDLYNKEKEKNKELETAYLLQKDLFNGFEKGYVSKDKIKCRLHDINNWLDNGRYVNYGLNPYELKAVKEELEELLGDDK